MRRAPGFGDGAAPRLLVVLASCSACDRAIPVPAQVERDARHRQLGLEASGAAAVFGTLPLGAHPPLPETPFRLEQGGRYCAPLIVKSCSLDIVDDDVAENVVTVHRDAALRFVGWAADETTRTIPRVVMLELAGEGSYVVPGLRLTPRPDVAAALSDPTLFYSGYDVLAALRAVERGTYAVKIIQVNARGEALSCDTRRTLVVK